VVGAGCARTVRCCLSLSGCRAACLAGYLPGCGTSTRHLYLSVSFSFSLSLSVSVARGRSAFSGGLARRQRLLDRAPPSRPPQLCRGRLVTAVAAPSGAISWSYLRRACDCKWIYVTSIAPLNPAPNLGAASTPCQRSTTCALSCHVVHATRGPSGAAGRGFVPRERRQPSNRA
jgi:hypothetical protein